MKHVAKWGNELRQEEESPMLQHSRDGGVAMRTMSQIIGSISGSKINRDFLFTFLTAADFISKYKLWVGRPVKSLRSALRLRGFGCTESGNTDG